MAARIRELLDDLRVTVKERIADIYTYLHGEMISDVSLGLSSRSHVAEWELWIGVVAFVSYLQEQLFEQAKVDLTAIRNSGISANKAFFAREWKKFQYGDPLLVDDDAKKYYYETIDPDKQLIKRLAIGQGVNSWELRVAKTVNGAPVKLSPDELNAFRAYVQDTAPPGPIIPIISRDSDKIRAHFTVYYDPIVPLYQVKEQVEAACLRYIATIDIEGESRYYISKHQDELEAVEGVVDVVAGSVEAKIEGSAFLSVERVYEPYSGYLEWDPESTLAEMITYKIE